MYAARDGTELWNYLSQTYAHIKWKRRFIRRKRRLAPNSNQPGHGQVVTGENLVNMTQISYFE